MSAKIFYYVPKARAHEFLELGWEKRNALEGTHHAIYSILMEWTKDDEPLMPPQGPPCTKQLTT